MGQLQCSRIAIAGTTGHSKGSAAPSAPLGLLLALLLLLAPPASRTAVAKLWRTQTRLDSTPPKYQEGLRLLAAMAAMAANCVPQASEPGGRPERPLRLTAEPAPPPRHSNYALTAAQPRRGVRRSQRSHEGRCGLFCLPVERRAVGVSCPWRRGMDGATFLLADTLAGTTGYHGGFCGALGYALVRCRRNTKRNSVA